MRIKAIIISFISAVMLGSVHADLEVNEDYKNGIEALENQLPEVAIKRLDRVAKAEDLTDKERVIVLYKLCEAQVRARQGTAAEQTLSHPLLSQHPDKSFWLAQSLVAQGRRKEAAEIFENIVATGNDTYMGLSLVALSELYRSLQEQEKAFLILEKAASMSKLSVAATIQLAEAYYEKQDIGSSRKVLEGVVPVRPAEKQAMTYLRAKLSLAEGELGMAKGLFKGLLESEQLKPAYKEVCTIGMGDVLALQGKHTEAINLIVKWIDEESKPDDSLLLMFNRLILWSEQLEETSELDSVLDGWIQSRAGVTLNGEDNLLEVEFEDRDAFSHFLLAKNLSRKNGENFLQRSLSLLNDMRASYPMHPFVSKSWFLTSQILLQQGKKEDSNEALENIVENGRTEEVKRRAMMLIGLAEADDGQIDQSIAKFKTLVSEASQILALEAQVNIALLELKRGDLVAFSDVTNAIADDETRYGLLLEEGVNALVKGEISARQKVIDIIEVAGSHPLVVSARMSLIRSYLAFQPFDIEESERQVALLKEQKLLPSQKLELAELEVRLLMYKNEWEKVIAKYTEEQELTKSVSDKLLISLGEAYYRNGEFNKARKEFNRLAKEFENSAYVEYAHFYSAMSARREGTPQSRSEALDLFQKVIDLEALFANEAVLQKSRLLIDSEKLDEARELLEKTLKEQLSIDVKANMKTLLAEVFHRLAVKDKNDKDLLTRAEALYKQVLAIDGMKDGWKHRVYFMLGQTQEKLDPTYARALDTYFKVINLEVQSAKDAPVEWEWYYECGLRAVDILEKEVRWGAAANLLDKMAGHYGPKSDVLIERASKIRLDYHIW